MKTTIFTESIDLSEAKIDSENRVIRDVVLIKSGMSTNRRYYSEDVLQKAAPVFHEVSAYANHPKPADIKARIPRDMRDTTGWYTNVVYENGRLRADRHFTRNQAGQDAWLIAEDIVNGVAPRTLAGLSINAVGQGKSDKFEDGEALRVESITSAFSVDDVSTPAAGGTYLTAGFGDALALQILNAMDYQEWIEARPEYTDRLKREWKQIRQDDAVKAVQIVADQLKTALTEAQAEIETLKSNNVMLSGELNQTRRELAIERALVKVQLPAQWKASLRNRLLEVETERWESIIEEELTKARANGKPRIAVTGAGQQISQPIAEASKPRNTAPDWNKVLESPEAFAAWKAQVNRSN